MSLVETDIFGTVRDKVHIAIERCREFVPPEGYYVAFSGGKDSIVALDIVRRSGVAHDVHMNMTSVDPPEIIRFIRRCYPDIEMHRPTRTMWQLIAHKTVPPTRIVRYCCGELKERGGDGRRVVTGIRWEESSKRAKRQSFEYCRVNPGKSYVHPIIEWTEKDVWEYIDMRGLYTPSLYEEGHRRVGCIMCPMAGPKAMRRDAERWPKFAEAYKRAIRRGWEKKVAQGKPTDGHWASPEAMYEWWISNPQVGKDDSQMCFRFDQFDGDDEDRRDDE